MKKRYLLIVVGVVLFSSCKKEPAEPSTPIATPSADLNAAILTDFSSNLPQATYNDLSSKPHLSIAMNLQACKIEVMSWRRTAW